MNPYRALWTRYLSGRKHVFALGPGQWRGMEISFGVSESLLSNLEGEELEDEVSSPEAFFPGWWGRGSSASSKSGA